MAASLMKSFPVGARNGAVLRAVFINQTWTRTAFFRRKKDKEDAEVTAFTTEEDQLADFTPTPILAHSLRKREGLQTVRGYKPPTDVEDRLKNIVSELCGEVADLDSFKFENNRVKFKVLTKAMAEFDHYIPNTALTSMETAGDAAAFFSTPVHDSSVYEDLSTLDLPPNLHIQHEPVRFDPETDTMFGGVSAFPGRPTVVSSLKYRRKYGKKDK